MNILNHEHTSDMVSIIVPIFKVEKYIYNCVDSIRKQTYTNIEIILVDDGSPDKCPRICDEYSKIDNRIRVIHKKNGGLSDARNAGLHIAKGEYVVFVDSDDVISEHMVSVMISTLEQSKSDLVAVGFGYFSTDDELQPIDEVPDSESIVFSRFEAIRQLFLNDSFCNYAWNKLYKREFFNDIEFPVGRKMEDLATTYLIFEQCNHIAFNSTCLYFYRQRSDSILHMPGPDFYRDKFNLTKKRYLYLKKRYGDFEENLAFMMRTIFECFQYIDSKEDKKWSKTELQYIMHSEKLNVQTIDKVKGLILIKLQPLYFAYKRISRK